MLAELGESGRVSHENVKVQYFIDEMVFILMWVGKLSRYSDWLRAGRRGSNPGGDKIFRPSRPVLGLPSLLQNGRRVFPGGKVRPGRAADHSPPSIAAVMEE